MLKHKDTKIRKFPRFVRFDRGRYLGNPEKLILAPTGLPDGTQLANNMSFHQTDEIEKQNQHFFLLDKTEFQRIKIESNIDDDALTNFQVFASHAPKTFYIRLIATQYDADFRIFAQDVILLLPVLMDKQKYQEQFENFQKNFESENPIFYNAISENGMNRILEDFDIDKSRVALVPDVIYSTSRDCLPERGLGPPRTYAPDGKLVVDKFQAAFHVFQKCVCRKICENCAERYQKSVLKTLEKYDEMDPYLFVCLEHPERQIQILQNLLCSQCKPTEPDPLATRNVDDYIKFYEYQKMADHLHLPTYPNFKSAHLSKNEDLPVWMARFYLCAGWFQTCFLKYSFRWKQFFLNGLMMMVWGPKRNRHFYEFLNHLMVCPDRQWPLPDFTRKTLLRAEERRLFFAKQKRIYMKKKQKELEKKKPEQPRIRRISIVKSVEMTEDEWLKSFTVGIRNEEKAMMMELVSEIRQVVLDSSE